MRNPRMLDGLDHQTCCFPDSELRTEIARDIDPRSEGCRCREDRWWRRAGGDRRQQFNRHRFFNHAITVQPCLTCPGIGSADIAKCDPKVYATLIKREQVSRKPPRAFGMRLIQPCDEGFRVVCSKRIRRFGLTVALVRDERVPVHSPAS